MRSKTGGSASTLERLERGEGTQQFGGPWGARPGCATLSRWWAFSTDREFLRVGEGRRLFWFALLPLPSLVSLIFDWSHPNLVMLHLCVAATLAAAGWMFSAFGMVELLWSDLAVASIHSAQVVIVHGLFDFTGDGRQSFMPPQVAAAFAMALAGVHSMVFAVFLAAMAVACSFFPALQWQPQDAVACAYLLLGSALVEGRLAVLWGERQAFRCGYKPLDTATGGYESAADDLIAKAPWVSVRSASAGPGVPAELLDYEPLTSGWAAAPGGPGLPASAVATRSISSALQQSPEVQPAQRWFTPAQDWFASAAATERVPAACATSDEVVLLRQDDEAAPVVAAALPRAAPTPQQRGTRPRRGLGRGLTDVAVARGTAGQSTSSSTAATPFPRAVILDGFRNSALNALFVERLDPQSAVDGRTTFWTAGEAAASAGRHFLYFDAAHNAWAAARADQLPAVQEGMTHSVAMGPPGLDIWDAGGPPNNGGSSGEAAAQPWREWDAKADAWVSRPQSGVQSRGKARPRDVPQEAAVQATPQLQDKGCQTTKVVGEDIMKLWTKER